MVAINSALQDRIGIGIWSGDATRILAQIQAAEAAGLKQVWVTQSPTTADTLSVLAAAAAQTQNIRLGTAIIPLFPRPPLLVAQQVFTIEDLAPGRFRLGLGVGNPAVTETAYGQDYAPPLARLREYFNVLRPLLWDGCADFHGQFFDITVEEFPVTRTPILISALGAKAFRLAGEIADGAISWMCPLEYLRATALPALREGAAAAGRSQPPLIAHVPVSLTADVEAARAVARQTLDFFLKSPTYVSMFTAAGFAVQQAAQAVEALIDELFVMGEEAQVAERLQAILASGIDEIVVGPVALGDETEMRARLAKLIISL
ncbi:MAG TPA: LLM class flavin-dependent oxidoreductase [Phototrophicaceae bacterium]|nr:LLM class flavin-dependent oxidoreductase [Phototrophicaceae bacterium]